MTCHCRDLVKLKTIKTKLCILAAAVGTQGVAEVWTLRVFIARNIKFIGSGVNNLANTFLEEIVDITNNIGSPFKT